MAQKGISEYSAKKLISENLTEFTNGKANFKFKGFSVTKKSNFSQLEKKYKWVKSEKIVAKVDQLVGKRGKHGLVIAGKNWSDTKKWLKSKLGKTAIVSDKKGELDTFLVEPFFAHNKEFYLAFKTKADSDVILFSNEGGIDIEENWDKVFEFKINPIEELDTSKLSKFFGNLEKKEKLLKLVSGLFKIFRELNFAYLEINPLGYNGEDFEILDTVARVDDCGVFESAKYWKNLEFPESFGSTNSKCETYIEDLDSKTGSSLKLTILNPNGKVWLMVAGGGASVIYADTVTDLGHGKELANYGEYSGDPTEEFTYQYAITVINEMLKAKTTGKVLLIGGGIANFTDVAVTFKGIIRAIKEKQNELKKQNIKIYVRRGGPHYHEGLEKMKQLGIDLDIPIIVHGPNHMMTEIVKLSLKGGTKND